MTKITLIVIDASYTLKLVDYCDSSICDSIDSLYDLARIHFVQVLETCSSIDDEAYEKDINALLSIADRCTSQFFVETVCKVLFADTCDVKLHVETLYK
jgi:hypothetical protein